MTLTDENKEKNLELFKMRLESIGIDCTQLLSLYGPAIKEASYAFNKKDGDFCGDGTLLQVILRTLTPTACKLMEFFDDIDKNSLIKICFLHQISKAIMVSPNTNTWEIENRGIMYKFNETTCVLKMGMRSVAMCFNCGIPLTELELEAISNLDREEDKQTKYFSSSLATVLRQANEITDIKNRINNTKNISING